MKNRKENIVPSEGSQQEVTKGYFVPFPLMDEILAYIGQSPWLKVNDLINKISKSIKTIELNEKQESFK